MLIALLCNVLHSFDSKVCIALHSYFIRRVSLKHRFTIILGERGIGKTTTLIQSLLESADNDPLSDSILYVQADHFLIGKTTLYEVAEEFYRLGGKAIAFDEIHKYSNWSMELKSIFDTFPNLKIIASGSSALEIQKGTHDLSRRAVVYHMVGLSLREFIELKYEIVLPTYSLNEIVNHHLQLANEVLALLEKKELKILKLLHEYLEFGYYPYFRLFEQIQEFKMTLEQSMHTALESDLASIYPHLTGNSIKKITQLLIYLSTAVPFIANWQAIRKITEIGDDRTVKTYFKYLEDAKLIMHIESGSNKLSKIEAAEKIYIANTNQLYAYTTSHPKKGTLRETFFLTMVKPWHEVNLSMEGDFMVDHQLHFEVGGKNKNAKQLNGNIAGYLAVDDIEMGSNRRIPLWLFGFLY